MSLTKTISFDATAESMTLIKVPSLKRTCSPFTTLKTEKRKPELNETSSVIVEEKVENEIDYK